MAVDNHLTTGGGGRREGVGQQEAHWDRQAVQPKDGPGAGRHDNVAGEGARCVCMSVGGRGAGTIVLACVWGVRIRGEVRPGRGELVVDYVLVSRRVCHHPIIIFNVEIYCVITTALWSREGSAVVNQHPSAASMGTSVWFL